MRLESSVRDKASRGRPSTTTVVDEHRLPLGAPGRQRKDPRNGRRLRVDAPARWLVATWDRVCLAVGAAVLAWLFYRQLLNGSLVVDGTRYYVLDDDMMISMRYGRNLADGHGLVWNVGEHVEGYTNFLWTLVMAGVHLLPLGDAHAAVAMKAISLVLVVASLWLSLRLLRIFVPQSRLAGALVVVGFVTCVDIVHWAAWGFETSLLGFLELVFLVCLLEGRRQRLGWLALALIPLVRSDAIALFAANAAAAVLLWPQGRRTLAWLGAALIPFGLHLAFRRLYYDDWLPNTYYLKLEGLDDRFGRGTDYAGAFLVEYGILVFLAALGAAALWGLNRRAIAVALVIAGSLGYMVTTGGDAFGEFRFMAHAMPLVLVLAAAGVVTLGVGRPVMVVAAVAFLVTAISPWRSPSALTNPGNNGDPPDQIATAILIKKNAGPDTRVAVMAAGIVPYLTHMEAVDMLGKNDRHVARLRPFPGAKVGHGKLDPAYSLATEPDLVVSYRSIDYVRALPAGIQALNPVERFLASPAFVGAYRPYPIEEPFLLSRTAVFTRPGSPVYARRRWQGIDVRR
jgi:arabinofuranosyltransferase